MIKGSEYAATIPRLMKQDNYAMIIMDGMSLRESSLMERKLSKKYNISMDYTYAPLPSDTRFFTEKYFGYPSPSAIEAKKNLPFIFHRVSRSDQLNTVKTESDKVIIWSALPDKTLHTFKEDFRIQDLAIGYKEAEELLSRLSDILIQDFDMISVTSDHGYIPDTHSWRGFRGFPSSKRYSRDVPQFLLSSCKPINGYFLLLGRYNTLKKGRYGHIRHGGLSLMEVLTPYLTISKYLRVGHNLSLVCGCASGVVVRVLEFDPHREHAYACV